MKAKLTALSIFILLMTAVVPGRTFTIANLSEDHDGSNRPVTQAQLFLRGSNHVESLDKERADLVLAEVTGYSSTVDQTDSTPYLTAHQTAVRDGIVACPRDVPFHTEIVIQGRTYACEDRMSLANDGKYDIWMASREEAIAWGRQEIIVKIYGLD